MLAAAADWSWPAAAARAKGPRRASSAMPAADSPLAHTGDIGGAICPLSC